MRKTRNNASVGARSSQRQGSTQAILFLLGLAGLSLLAGCSLLGTSEKVVKAVVPHSPSKRVDPVDMQVQVQRFADDYSAQTATAVDEYARQMGTEAARIQGLQWKLAAGGAAIALASGPQPKANLIDLVSLAVLNRVTVEEYARNSTNARAFELWVTSSRLLETNAWALAANELPPIQLKELRDAIAQWQEGNPGVRNVFATRPQEFAAMIKTSRQKTADVNSVFSLVGLDPTAGLDPAVHEVTLTRLFAERAMFAMQRMPTLLRWQIELLAHNVASQPATHMVVTNAARLSDSMDRIGRAAESVSQTAAKLPDQVAAERKAVLAALDQQEGKLRGLATEVTKSVEAAEKMSASLTVTITNFDALMKRFGIGEPSTNSVPDTNSRPFNILDYGQTAAQIGAMAKDVNALITSVNQSMPEMERLSAQASAEAQRTVDRAFRLGLILIGVLLVGGVLAGLTYRKLGSKIGSRSERS